HGEKEPDDEVKGQGQRRVDQGNPQRVPEILVVDEVAVVAQAHPGRRLVYIPVGEAQDERGQDRAGGEGHQPDQPWRDSEVSLNGFLAGQPPPSLPDRRAALRPRRRVCHRSLLALAAASGGAGHGAFTAHARGSDLESLSRWSPAPPASRVAGP